MANSAIDLGDAGRRFCDLVMKGGITSGIVFPTAVARLSTQYRFRNIGGTSAGAIAAAGAAAAEFRRSTDRTNPGYGFAELARLPEFLGQRPEGRHSRLFDLFQPEPAVRRHFAILAAMLNRGGRMPRAGYGALAALRGFPLAAVVGAVPGIILLLAARGAAPLNVLAVLIAASIVVAGSVVAALASAAVSLARALPMQQFGLARGHALRTNGDTPALTDWLHPYLQDLAGRSVDRPLTFGDLDGAVLDEVSAIRGINLQMMTTALSLGRPYSLPFDNEQFYFDAAELDLYFPEPVVAWMVANPGPRSTANRARDEAMAEFGYRPFPVRATLPVVVAVRMSLSFPLLLSGVPLYRYAWEIAREGVRRDADPQPTAGAPANEAAEASMGDLDEPEPLRDERFVAANVRKVVFSDGGICSNFPVHMFDAVLPGWPTFGINLRDDLRAGNGDDERAFLPQRGTSLPPEEYTIAASGAEGIISFATAIVRTMQNWRDNLQRAAPGFRDRVVTIRHTPREGGLNLDMAAGDIDAMASSGAAGAQKLIDAFARPASLHDDHFTYHRWVRIRSLLNVLQQMLREIHQGVTVIDNDPPYPDLIRDAPDYVGGSYRLSEGARSAAAELLDALDRLDHELDDDHVDYSRGAPRPEVELRIQPVL